MGSPVKISIVIPMRNEQDNIGQLVKDLQDVCRRMGREFEIVIVDDNSSDSTGKIADELSQHFGGITVLHRKSGVNGMGISLKEGTTMASGEIVIWVMGDRSDELGRIPVIVQKLEAGCDMVLGSRYMKGGSRGSLQLSKALCGAAFTIVARLMFGMPVHDITNAFRGFWRRVFDGMELESNDFAISPEFSIKARLGGFRIGEVPTTYRNRESGKSNFNMMRMGFRYASLFRCRLKLG